MRQVDTIPRIPRRRRDGHKGDFGHVLVLAGSPRMTGAALLTSRGALRSGAGLVTLGMPSRIQVLLAPALLCEMSLPLPSTETGSFAREAVDPALDFCTGRRVSSVALGPGITTDDDTGWFATRVAMRAPVPLVLDADGLNCLARSPAPFRASQHARVITPHPGEAARLLRRSAKDVQVDRIGAAEELAGRFGAVAVLKGYRTVVTDGDRVFVNETGNPGMATGGSGDVLTGMLSGLLAQGLEAFYAAVLAVHVHGLAADLAAAQVGELSFTAADLLDHLGRAYLTVLAD